MPTNGDTKDDGNTSTEKSDPALTEAKRREQNDGSTSEQNDKKYGDRKLKLAAWWKYFHEHGHKWIEAGCAVLLVIITGCYTYVAWHQWCEMRRTNDLTKLAMHSSGRAWVGIESATPISFDKTDQGAMLNMIFVLKNYGHSAAEHVRIFPKLYVLGPPRNNLAVSCEASNAEKYIGDVVLPEQPRQIPWGVGITSAEINSALAELNPAIGRDNIPGFVLAGCVEYIDDPTEKTPHHTPFVYFVTRPAKGFISTNTKHIPGKNLAIESNPIYPGPTN